MKITKVQVEGFEPIYFLDNKLVRQSQNILYEYKNSPGEVELILSSIREYSHIFENKTTISETESSQVPLQGIPRGAKLHEVLHFPYFIFLFFERYDFFRHEKLRNLKNEVTTTVSINKDLKFGTYSLDFNSLVTIIEFSDFIKNVDLLYERIKIEPAGLTEIEPHNLSQLVSIFKKRPRLCESFFEGLRFTNLRLLIYHSSDIFLLGEEEITFLRTTIEKFIKLHNKNSLKFLEIKFENGNTDEILKTIDFLFDRKLRTLFLSSNVTRINQPRGSVTGEVASYFILKEPPEKRIEKITTFLSVVNDFSEENMIKSYLSGEKDVELRSKAFVTYLKALIKRKVTRDFLMETISSFLDEISSQREFVHSLFDIFKKDNSLSSTEKEYLEAFLYMIATTHRNEFNHMFNYLSESIFKSKKKFNTLIRLARVAKRIVPVPSRITEKLSVPVIEAIVESILNRYPVEIENEEEFFRKANLVGLSDDEKLKKVTRVKTLTQSNLLGVNFTRTILTLLGTPFKFYENRVTNGLKELLYNTYLILKEVEKEGKDVEKYADLIAYIFAEATGSYNDYILPSLFKRIEREIMEDHEKFKLSVDIINYMKRVFKNFEE